MFLILIALAVPFFGLTLHVLGFTAAGIAAASFAAGWQAILGNVMAGSIFAVVQSFAALFWGSAFGSPGIVLALIFIFALWQGYLW